MPTTTDDLAVALRTERLGPTTFQATAFQAHIPDKWQQGRGAFGGLVLGLLARAMEQVEPEPDRSLRTLAGELVAPVLPGEATLQVRVMRKGNGLTALAAELTQKEALLAHATAIFSKPRPEDRDGVYLSRPSPRPWQEVEIVPVMPPWGPEFAAAFEFRPTAKLPFTGQTEPGAEGWIRLKKPLARLGAAELVVHADAWWPVGFAVEQTPRPMATVAFSVQLCVDPATVDPQLPLFHRASPLAIHQGHAMELRELWTADGRLVSVNPQTFAIIR